MLLDHEVGFGPQTALSFDSPAQGEYQDST